MTQVLSSSPPSLSLPAFATFSLEEPPSAFQAQQSTTTRRADRDAHTAHTSVQSIPHTATGGAYPPRATSASSAAMASSHTTAHPGAGNTSAGNTPVNGTQTASTIEGTSKQAQSPTNGHARQQSSAALISGDPSSRPTQSGTLSPAISSQHSDAKRPTSVTHAQQPQMYYSDTSRSPSPLTAASCSSNTSAPSSRSGTPVGGGPQNRPQHHQYASSSSHRVPSPSPSRSYSPLPPSHHHSGQHSPHYQRGPNMAPTHQSPSHHPMHLNEANSVAMQAAMMQAAYQQQQQHFQAQMNAMLAAGYSQHQLAQHFQQQQQLPSAGQPSMANQHDPRRRAPSLPNSPNGGGLINNAGYFPSAPHHQQQYYHTQAHPSQLPEQQQPYYHPQFVHQQQYPQSSPHIHHPHYSPYPSPPPIASAMRGSPVSSLHGSPGRDRAPTAPSALHSPVVSAGNSPASGNGRIMPNSTKPPFASHSTPSSPGGVADLARRRAETQPNDQRVPLAPTTATQQQLAPSQRDRTASTPSESRKPSPVTSLHNTHGRPSPSSQLQHKVSADFASPLPRIRTDSGTSSNSATSNASGARAASPASTTSDRAPTPTQALHTQLMGSSTSNRSGRTTPTASSSGSPSPAAQQQSLGLQPSIKLINGSFQDVNSHAASAPGIIRKASPLSQQSSYSDGHRSITPTQASASGIVDGHTAKHDSDQETEVITAQHATRQPVSKHRATLSNASSSMSSSPQTPSSGKSGSSLFRNKLRKAMSLSELNNSSSTLSSGDASSSSNKLGRTSLTSNSSSSDTSHSTAEPRTPPNGAPPGLPRGFTSASTSNLNSSSADLPNEHGVQNGRATPSSSMPSATGRRFGILNSKMNSSTDNISISSTVSSASMMLRKMGNFGRLARKSSVRSLSNLFHRDKHDREDSECGDHTGSKAASDAVSEFGVPGAAMLSSKDRKKGSIADPSIAHVTVELERGEAAKAGMTPAAALARKHQERERAQKLEEEERIIRSRTASTSSSVGGDNAKSKNQQEVTSPRSKLLEKEKERLKNQNAGKKSLAKKFSFGAFSKSASSSSLRQEALHASTNSSNQQAEDKDSPRSSSSSSSANASPIFDSSATSSGSASPVILQHEVDTRQFAKPLDIDFRPSLDGVQLDTWRNGPAAISGISMHPLERRLEVQDEENDEGFDDRTPRQSMELIGDQSTSSTQTGNYSDWDGEPPNGASFFDDDTASFRDEADHAAMSHVANKIPFYIQQEPEEYASDSGADGNGRNGQAIPKRPPPHARPAKGILKYARSYSQSQLSAPQPAFAGRPRANSYDAPHQMHPPNQPGQVATLAQYIPTSDELDGVANHPASASRLDTRVPSPYENDHNKENLSPSSSSSFSPGTSPYNHPNTSEPILSNLKSVHMATRSVTGPIIKRNISFAQNLSVHTTWSGSTYDRRGDSATCNRLTPQLAQAIKEELNAFKMDEMAVHHQSRGYTHFFL